MGCSYNSIREVEPNRSFDGLDQLFSSDAETPKRAHLNVVFVHGMGHHPFGETGIRDYQQRIAKELGFTAEDRRAVDWASLCPHPAKESDFELQLKRESPDGPVTEYTLLEELRKEGEASCPLRINGVIVGYVGWRQYQHPTGDSTRVLNLFELSWDRATEMLQKTILELDDDYRETIEVDDNLQPLPGGRNREADRVWANSWLKQFVNRQLGDPVVYLGAYGDSVRRTVADGLLKIASAEGGAVTAPYVIISDSLGSRIVFDTLGCVLNTSPGEGCEFLRSGPKLSAQDTGQIRALVANTAQVFMNANQLPLLALSEATGPKPNEGEIDWLKRLPCESTMSGMEKFQRAIMTSRKISLKSKDGKGRPVAIIAFTDPNDPLSYHLTRRFRNQCTSLAGDGESVVEFINVRISNAKWNYAFVLADPYKAHADGFRNNDNAIDLVVHGYASTTVP